MDDMSPEEMQALLATNGDPAQLEDIRSQLESARRLRGNTVPSMTQAGNAMFANTGAILGNALAQYAGRRDEKKLLGQQSDIYKNQADRLNNWMTARYGRPAPAGMMDDPTQEISAPDLSNLPSMGQPRFPSSPMPVRKPITGTAAPYQLSVDEFLAGK